MSDVTALVLTIGEPYTQRALESVHRQSFPCADLVVVEGVSPFHRAFNAGVLEVQTEFFVQVDADFVLDADCFEALRACMHDRVGYVTGRLRDPLLGRIGAVRLNRTVCFDRDAFPDTISPDTDFAATTEARGWRRVDALKWRDGARNLLHTFGDHCPDYTPLYTFAKFRLTGARCRHRRDAPVLRDLVGRLHGNPHPAARLALVALGHGVFLRETNDQLHVFEPDAESELAERFFGATSALREHVPVVARAEGSADTFARFTSLGAELVTAGNSHGVVPLLEQLSGEATSGNPSLIALLGLCHGLFSPLTGRTNADSDYALLEGWLAVEGRSGTFLKR